MKLFISCDIEGCAGVVDGEQCRPGGSLYEEGRALMAGECNAAISGALEAGAKRIVVNDSHGPMTNLSPMAIHPAAELILGGAKSHSMVEGLDDSFDAAAFVGYHAHAGTINGVLAHNYIGSAVNVIKVNGKQYGEIGLNAMYAGHLGVPVVFLSGDIAATREYRALIRAGHAVSTKKGLGRRSAQSVHPQTARNRIHEGICKALRSAKPPKPFSLKGPYRLEVSFHFEEMADFALRLPGSDRKGPYTVGYRHTDFYELYRGMQAMITLGAAVGRR